MQLCQELTRPALPLIAFHFCAENFSAVHVLLELQYCEPELCGNSVHHAFIEFGSIWSIA